MQGELMHSDQVAAVLREIRPCRLCLQHFTLGAGVDLDRRATAIAIGPDGTAHAGALDVEATLCSLDARRWRWLVAVDATDPESR